MVSSIAGVVLRAHSLWTHSGWLFRHVDGHQTGDAAPAARVRAPAWRALAKNSAAAYVRPARHRLCYWSNRTRSMFLSAGLLKRWNFAGYQRGPALTGGAKSVYRFKYSGYRAPF